MCSPMLAAAAALSVAGTAANMQGQKQAQKAATAATMAEQGRQDRYQKEGMGVWDLSLDRSRSENQMARLNDRSDVRGDLMEGSVKDFDPNTDLLSGQSQAPDLIRNTVAGEVTKAVNTQRAEGRAKALLDAWGDLNLDNATFNQRQGDKIGMTGRFAQSSANILPLELQAAQRKGGGMRMFGDLLSGAGALTGMAGSAGFGPQSFGNIFASTPAAGTGIDPVSRMKFAI